MLLFWPPHFVVSQKKLQTCFAQVKEVVRSMPSLLPSFTPSPASLEGFTARPAITLDPEQDPDPRSSSLLLDPEEIHQLPDLEDNHL